MKTKQRCKKSQSQKNKKNTTVNNSRHFFPGSTLLLNPNFYLVPSEQHQVDEEWQLVVSSWHALLLLPHAFALLQLRSLSWGMAWRSAPIWFSMGCRRTTSFTAVILLECRAVSAQVPGKSAHPSLLTWVSTGLLLMCFFLTVAVQFFSLILS